MSTETRRREMLLKYLSQPRTTIALANALFGTHAGKEATTRSEVADTLEGMARDGLVGYDRGRWVALCQHPDATYVDLREGRAHLEEMPTEDAIVRRCDNCGNERHLTDAEMAWWYAL